MPRLIVLLLLSLATNACGTAIVRDAVLARQLTPIIEAEMAAKGIPGLSIAVLDADGVLFASGFGLADPTAAEPATATTVYRVGSVSKLFTDLAIMQLVEQGRLELDAPVTRYLPDFAPHNPFGGDITLRQLMCHRAGLVREPPIGNYFDAGTPTLAATVDSLSRTTLVHAPGARTKYSNAGIAVLGRVIEVVTETPFPTWLQRAVLAPAGLDDSAFLREPRLADRTARGGMWSHDGRTFAAPTFDLGMAPAGCLYTTVLDLAQFLHVLMGDGEGPRGHLISNASLAVMLTPQGDPARGGSTGGRGGYGLGFHIGELDGQPVAGHGGAIYGFATRLAFQQDAGIGVVVTANLDATNAVVNRIADHALRLARARRDGTPPPAWSATAALAGERIVALAGRYQAADGRTVRLLARDERLLCEIDTRRAEVRDRDGELTLDDRTAFGPVLLPTAAGIVIDGTHCRRVPEPRPAPCPAGWRGLLGEYGPDHNTLFVYERDGALHALVEWIEIDRLRAIDADRFAFPERSMYQGEELVFERGADGRARVAIAGGMRLERRALLGEGKPVFAIEPLRPLDELRASALAASPPQETGPFRTTDLVELIGLDDSLGLDIRYASTQNFLSTPFYSAARAFLQRDAALALVRVQRELAAEGLGLLIHDAYRPWYVTKMFFDATPEHSREFVADPQRGSRHNRGCAVDLTLLDRATGTALDLGGLYDEMTERSYPDYPVATAEQRWLRDRLRRAMADQGFTVYPAEWWHFDYRDWRDYAIGNLRFEDLDLAHPPESDGR